MARMPPDAASTDGNYMTKIFPVHHTNIGHFSLDNTSAGFGDGWNFEAADTVDFRLLEQAADALRTTNVPVAFPTETVYGLGADATRSAAVKAIYKAKGRPSDNPLIVHFASLQQLQSYTAQPIPPIYTDLVKAFWPGPLTILLPVPEPSPFAPEITAGLATFGARVPRNVLALALIKLADRPISAPSANASTRPSPTAAEHVYDDLAGRIEYIIDGGPCDVGVESTVVDGLSSPPAILRPGGISLEQLRRFPGWEDCIIGYGDLGEGESNGKIAGAKAPRAPGMKYRHYSPAARVVLYEAGAGLPDFGKFREIGVIRTATWPIGCGENIIGTSNDAEGPKESLDVNGTAVNEQSAEDILFPSFASRPVPMPNLIAIDRPIGPESDRVALWDVDLSESVETVARGLFSALRELDRRKVEAIFVEGIDETKGELAAAVMNRLRKASSVKYDAPHT